MTVPTCEDFALRADVDIGQLVVICNKPKEKLHENPSFT